MKPKKLRINTIYLVRLSSVSYEKILSVHTTMNDFYDMTLIFFCYASRSETRPPEDDEEEEEEILGSDDDEQEDPKDYVKGMYLC